MTDKEYELNLKDVDCCQNCVHFSLGMHFDGCPKGWCSYGGGEIHYRDDLCMKYKSRIYRRAENE